MLNTNGSTFIGPHWNLSSRFSPFDPWNSHPVLWFGGTKAKFVKSSWNVVRLTYLTQGFAPVLRTILYYLPKSSLRSSPFAFTWPIKSKALPALAEASYIPWVGALSGRSEASLLPNRIGMRSDSCGTMFLFRRQELGSVLSLGRRISHPLSALPDKATARPAIHRAGRQPECDCPMGRESHIENRG